MDNHDESPKERRKLLANDSDMDKQSEIMTEAQAGNQDNSASTNAGCQLTWKRLRFYLVEPMVLILVFAYNLSGTVWKNQIIYQTCTAIFEYNETDCRKMSTRNTSDYIKAIEAEIQPYTAVLFMAKALLQSLVPALCGSFLGSWSDRFGRKPLLIASFTGYFIFYAVTCLISFISETNNVNPWMYLTASIPLSLLGDGVTYSVATFCYISDVSTAKERPYRMTLYEAVIYIGLMMGSFTAGYIYDAYKSSTVIFLISAISVLSATLVVIFIIPESLNSHPTENDDNVNLESNDSTNIQQPQQQDRSFRKLFDIDHIKALYATCFKNREHEARSIILLIVGSLLICAFIVDGSVTVFYLFVRKKFQWSVKEFTTYETVSVLVPILGNIFGIWLLRKCFKLQLLHVAIMGLISQSCSSLMKGFAAVNWQLYIAIVLGVLKSIVNPMLRTVLTNILPANELGKIFSFISAIQAFLPFLASPLYTLIYRATLNSFPGFFNIVNANLFIVAICLILMVETAIKSSLATGFKELQWEQFFHMFYIEPVVFIRVFSGSLSGTIMRNEIIHQACTTIFQYNASDCVQLGTKNVSGYLQEIETEVQPYVANLFMIRTLLESIVPAICGVFVGSWSDHYGRKPLLLVSMIGFSCTYVIAAIICELSQWYSISPWYYLLSVIPHSILGGNCVFTVAAFCFISDVTDMKTRPYRMISLEAFLSVGLMAGALLSSYVYAATNATVTFSISGILMCLATVFVAVCIPESLNSQLPTEIVADTKDGIVGSEIPINCSIISEALDFSDKAKAEDFKDKANNLHNLHMKNDKEKTNASEHAREDVQDLKNDTFHDVDLNKTDHKPEYVENGKCAIDAQKKSESDDKSNNAATAGLFSYIHVKEMWITSFKKRPYYDRSIILLITGAMFLSIFVMDGAMTVYYLFVREKFQWNVREFSYFETISHVTSMCGALVGFLILRKIFCMSVVTLTLLAFLSEIIRNIVQAMAYASWHLYLATAVGSLRAVGGPMCRTIVSNIVPPTDLGKIFSIKNILQSLAPFVAAPLYTEIYKASLSTFPGLFNVVSAGLFFIAFIFILFVFRFKVTNKEHYGEMLK